MKKINILLIFLFLSFTGFSQLSIIQDKSGESSIALSNQQSIMLNAGDASIGASVSYAKVPAGKRERFWSFNLKFGSTEKVSKLLDGYDFKPKFEASVFRGYYLQAPSLSVSHYLYFGGSIKNSYFKLWSDKSTAELDSKNFFGYYALLGYNNLGTLGSLSTTFGISASYGRFDNLEDLDDVDKYAILTNNGYTILSDKKTGFTGPYSTSGMAKIKADYLVFTGLLANRLSIGTYYRGGFGGDFAKSNIGAGVFLGNQSAPSNILLGLVFQANDIFNQLDSKDGFQKRTGINLIAGYRL